MDPADERRSGVSELQQIEHTTDLAPGVKNLGWYAQELDYGFALAQKLCTTAFAPAHFRGKPADAATAMLYGNTLGLDPIASMRSVYVVHGTPALYASTMMALAVSAGHEIVRESATEQEVVFKARRRGSEVWQEVKWTMTRAERAGYTANKKYSTDPVGMLSAKCMAEAAKLVAPDALMGLRSVEDIELEEGPEVEAKPVKRRSVQRKPKAPEPEVPELPEIEEGDVDESAADQ